MCRVLIYIFLPVAFALYIINCEHDSLNPIAVLSSMVGMWLNCTFGGKGIWVINMLLFLITAQESFLDASERS
jgi:K+-transporting ATPase A subunit